MRSYLDPFAFQAPTQYPEPVRPLTVAIWEAGTCPILAASPCVMSGSPSSQLRGAAKTVSAFAGEDNMGESLIY